MRSPLSRAWGGRPMGACENPGAFSYTRMTAEPLYTGGSADCSSPRMNSLAGTGIFPASRQCIRRCCRVSACPHPPRFLLNSPSAVRRSLSLLCSLFAGIMKPEPLIISCVFTHATDHCRSSRASHFHFLGGTPERAGVGARYPDVTVILRQPAAVHRRRDCPLALGWHVDGDLAYG